ncbi:MAG: sigma-70 family RNA polymerase sigma factor [Victivallales bacterium]|nr:sigma-70 family RNA polymerase sigma factor [Victivallales bacterium]
METNTLEQDVELIRRCQAGDDSAFNVLYSRYRLQLYSYLNKLLPNDKSHIDDFFQQTWIKAFNNFGRYNDQQRFLAWICRIAHNQVMDFFRRQKGTVMVELDDHLPGGFDTADKEIDRSILENAVEEAVQTLSKEQKQVLEMRREGKSFKEIAAIQGTSLNTVLGRMHYAVEKLKGFLMNYK